MADEQWKRPARALLRLRRIEAAVVTVALAIALTATGDPIFLVVALVVGVLLERFFRRRFLAWGYAEREDDLLVKRGVMFSRLSVIPYGRMQYIDVSAGPLERAFGLATVKMHTAAAASDARIPGL